MHVVVTGGSGQLGTLVLERLALQRKIKKIVSLDLVPPMIPSPRIDWRIADLRDPGLERHLEGADALVHLAFVVARAASEATMRAVNVEGSKRIFDAALRHGIRRIVYSSSASAYGVVPGHQLPLVEASPRKPTPTLVYASNKYEVEEYLDAFEAANPEVAVVRLRPGVLLGRRVAHLGERFLRRRLMPVLGDARGPVVWDEDVADAVVLALTGEARGAFNLVAEAPLTGEDFARLAGFRTVRIPPGVVDVAGRASRALASVLGEKRIDVGWLEAAGVDLDFSSEKARRELGWKPRHPTSGDVAIAFGKSVRGSTDRRIAFFLSAVPRLARRAREQGDMPREARTMSLTVHLDLTGPRGGDFTLRLKEGVLSLTRGIPRPPDATVVLSAETFLDLLSGKLEPSTASLTGKIKVRGEPIAGMVVSGIIGGFRRATGAKGAHGKIAQRLSRWFQEGTKS